VIVKYYFRQSKYNVDNPDVSDGMSGKNPTATREAFKQFIGDVEMKQRCPDPDVLDVVAAALSRVLEVDVSGKQGRNKLRKALGLTPPKMKDKDRIIKLTICHSVAAMMENSEYANDKWKEKRIGNCQPRLPRTRAYAAELVAISLVKLGIVPYIDSDTVQKIHQKYALELT